MAKNGIPTEAVPTAGDGTADAAHAAAGPDGTIRLLRREGIRRRGLLSDAQRREAGRVIAEKLFRLPAYRQCGVLLSYVSYGPEADTRAVIRRALADGKAVFCPRVCGRDMDFYRIGAPEELAPGFRGILEPPACAERLKTDSLQNALALVPGTAFDRSGHRIGYGGGYYDRYFGMKQAGLQGGQRPYLIGLCYACQMEEDIPFRPHDIVMDLVLTEEQEKNHMSESIQMEEDCMNAPVHTKDRVNRLTEMGERAVAAKYALAALSPARKDRALLAAAGALIDRGEELLSANALDLEAGKAAGMRPGMLDRLALTKERIGAMAEGLRQIAALPDPVGEVLETFTRPNGLEIEKRRVPLGVIGIIYESRPNVTADAFGLCFKTGNAVILKGGSDAIRSNAAIEAVLRDALEAEGITPDAIQLIRDTDRAVTEQFMRMKTYVDVLIPRGGAGLIRAVVENATVPVIETGTGNCHIFVDESADIDMAVKIILNAKTQRIGVCNACESLVVHEKIRQRLLPALAAALREKHVEIRADERVREVIDGCVPVTEEDYGMEYLDYIISMKTVDSVEEAIAHINRYNTKHSDAILTQNPENAEKFLAGVDAACVYVNASTRFTDGFEFGFGAEIGISTQKLHARGPMGLKELTTYKYAIRGNGQVRG